MPSFGAGDFFLLTGSYTQNATWYSGLPDAMWGENGQVNGNGQAMNLGDAFFNPATNRGRQSDRVVGVAPCSSITSRRSSTST